MSALDRRAKLRPGTGYFRFWHLADIPRSRLDVCFWGKADPAWRVYYVGRSGLGLELTSLGWNSLITPESPPQRCAFRSGFEFGEALQKTMTALAIAAK